MFVECTFLETKARDTIPIIARLYFSIILCTITLVEKKHQRPVITIPAFHKALSSSARQQTQTQLFKHGPFVYLCTRRSRALRFTRLSVCSSSFHERRLFRHRRRLSIHHKMVW